MNVVYLIYISFCSCIFGFYKCLRYYGSCCFLCCIWCVDCSCDNDFDVCMFFGELI